MKWQHGAGVALVHVICTALIPVLMLAGGYIGSVVGGHLSEPDYQSAAERAARPPGDDPHYFFAHLLGGVVGFVGTGLLLPVGYAIWLARRKRQPTARSNSLRDRRARAA